MVPAPISDPSAKLILRGIYHHLTPATKVAVEAKAERLFRHEPSILRLRIDLERGLRGRLCTFIAKGRVEIAGPDLTAAVTTEDPRAAIHLLIDKLDRMLRKRTTSLLRHRASGDIRTHVTQGV